MRPIQRRLAQALIVLAVASSTIAGALFAISILRLRQGPSVEAYGALEAAIPVTVLSAVLVSAASIAVALGRQKPVRVHGFVMLLASGLTAGIAVSLVALGSALAGTDTAAQQTPDLNSLILALRGVGLYLWPVPVLLAIGAVGVWTSPFFGGRNPKRSTKPVPA